MRTMNTVLGQELLSLADGRRVGSVKDLVVGPDNARILAIVVEEPGLMSAGAVVSADAVHSYGKDAIVIEDGAAVQQPDDLPEIAEAMEHDASLLGMKVYSDAGEQQGSVSDVYFDEASSRIVGFQVSAGTIGDLASGPRYLGVEEVDHYGSEVIYVRPDVAQHLADQQGGLQAAVADLGERAGSAASDLGERAGQAASGIGQRVNAATQDARQAVPDVGPGDDAASIGAGSQPAEDGSELSGRRSGADVSASDGSLVVATGQRIEQRHVDWAREHGAVDVLRAAADDWDRRERERMVGGTVETIRDTAGSVWDRFMATIADVTDASGRRMSEQQTKARLKEINEAVGRPVTKVMLDRDDEVILNLGDIITHQAIQRAYEAGILDSLLDSVYKGEVSFERDEMKAPVQGTSSVEQAAGGASVVAELEQQVARTEQERRDEGERRSREATEMRAQRDQERSERAAQREEAARAASEEPDIAPDVPLAVPAEGGAPDDAGQADRGGQPSGGEAGGTWMEEPDAPLASSRPSDTVPDEAGGTWMERSDEASPASPDASTAEPRGAAAAGSAMSGTPSDEIGSTPPAASAALRGSYPDESPSDAGMADDPAGPLDAEEPHDAPAEGRSLDLPGADREDSLDDVIVGDERREPTDEDAGLSPGEGGGAAAGEVGLSDEGDHTGDENGLADDVPRPEDTLGDVPPGATSYRETAPLDETVGVGAAESADQAHGSLSDDPAAELHDLLGQQGETEGDRDRGS